VISKRLAGTVAVALAHLYRYINYHSSIPIANRRVPGVTANIEVFRCREKS
jgi:hypothetical protein